MITVEKTTVEWVLANYAVDKAIEDSVTVWKVVVDGEVKMVLGFIMASLIGWAELWVLPVKIDRSILRARKALVETMLENYQYVSVHTDSPVNAKFARFFGFEPKGPQTISGKTWERYELWQHNSQ